MAESTFSTPDLATFVRLETPGLQVTGQFLEQITRCSPAGLSLVTTDVSVAAGKPVVAFWRWRGPALEQFQALPAPC